MKRTWIFGSVVVLILTTVTSADLYAPGDLNPGDTFRWVFKTSAVTDAHENWASHYDAFVNKVADDAADPAVHNVQGISDVGEINWQAIVSTRRTVIPLGARAHIGEFTGEVYNTRSEIVAHSSADLFDGAIENPVKYDESGGPTPSGTRDVWTGSVHTGDEDMNGGLGSVSPAVGDSFATDDDWLNKAYDTAAAQYSVYAISEELTVVPVPGAALLGFIGLATSSLALRKREEAGIESSS